MLKASLRSIGATPNTESVCPSLLFNYMPKLSLQIHVSLVISPRLHKENILLLRAEMTEICVSMCTCYIFVLRHWKLWSLLKAIKMLFFTWGALWLQVRSDSKEDMQDFNNVCIYRAIWRQGQCCGKHFNFKCTSVKCSWNGQAFQSLRRAPTLLFMFEA